MIRIFALPLILFLAGLPLSRLTGQTASPLSLEDCYSLARAHHPQAREAQLIDQTTALRLENLKRRWWPQAALYGQATLQSEVTELPIELPGIEIETLAKDQYKLYAEVNQTLYDGGAIRVQQELQGLQQAVQQQSLEVKLYQIREGIDQAFFGVLLLDQQLAQLDLIEKDIQTAQQKVKAAIDNGLAFASQLDILLAERLKLQQKRVEMEAGRRSFLRMLALMTGSEIGPETSLQKPNTLEGTSLSADLNRPELLLIQRQSKLISAQAQMLEVSKRPKAGLFVQGGYGRPALNFLSNAFTPYAIGGLRVSWDISPFYTQSNDRQLLEIQRKQLAIQEESFRYQMDLSTSRQYEEIDKLKRLLETDNEIISLRQKIQQTAEAQLANGVLSANDYLRELNAADQARQNQIVHQTQLLLAQYQLKSLLNQ